MNKISKSWEFIDAFVYDTLIANGFKVVCSNPLTMRTWRGAILDQDDKTVARLSGSGDTLYVSTKGFWGQQHFDAVDLCTIDDATGEDFGDWQNPGFDPSHWVDRILRLILRRRKWRKLRAELGLETKQR